MPKTANPASSPSCKRLKNYYHQDLGSLNALQSIRCVVKTGYRVNPVMHHAYFRRRDPQQMIFKEPNFGSIPPGTNTTHAFNQAFTFALHRLHMLRFDSLCERRQSIAIQLNSNTNYRQCRSLTTEHERRCELYRIGCMQRVPPRSTPELASNHSQSVNGKSLR